MGRLYFAYGSNMHPAQMLSRCPHSKAVAKATVKGYKLAINSRGVATIVKSENSRVSGVVWKISASDEAALDFFEGVHVGAYAKLRMDLCLGENRIASALVYVDKNSEAGVPRAGYLEKIIRGAKFFGLGRDYISKLERLAYA